MFGEKTNGPRLILQVFFELRGGWITKGLEWMANEELEKKMSTTYQVPINYLPIYLLPMENTIIYFFPGQT